MRTRTQGGIVTQPVNSYTSTRNCSGAVVINDLFATSLRNGYTKTTIDVVNPGFRKLVARGRVFCNNFSSVEITEASSCSGVDVHTYVPTCTSTKSIEYGPWAVNAWGVPIRSGEHAAALSSARALSATEALANVAEPNVQGLVELAELNKTARMIPNQVRNSIRLLRGLQASKKFRRSGKLIGEYIAGTYLMYRYGITPLKHTVDGLHEAILRSGTVSSPRYTARSTKETGSFDFLEPSMLDGVIRVMYNKASHISSVVRSGVLYEHRLSFDSYGVSLREVPSAIWELVPYSFVADWFLNAGDFIRAVTPKSNVNILASWQTVTTQESRSYNSFTVANQPDPNWSLVCGRSNAHNVVRVTKTRNCGLSAKLATKFHEITFEKQRDFLHAADALALLSKILLSR